VCVISCLVAVHGYLARLDGVDIELLRRSSFGFLEPNVVAMSDSIRISPGLLNCSPSESDLLTLALNVTNNAVHISIASVRPMCSPSEIDSDSEAKSSPNTFRGGKNGLTFRF